MQLISLSINSLLGQTSRTLVNLGFNCNQINCLYQGDINLPFPQTSRTMGWLGLLALLVSLSGNLPHFSFFQH